MEPTVSLVALAIDGVFDLALSLTTCNMQSKVRTLDALAHVRKLDALVLVLQYGHWTPSQLFCMMAVCRGLRRRALKQAHAVRICCMCLVPLHLRPDAVGQMNGNVLTMSLTLDYDQIDGPDEYPYTVATSKTGVQVWRHHHTTLDRLPVTHNCMRSLFFGVVVCINIITSIVSMRENATAPRNPHRTQLTCALVLLCRRRPIHDEVVKPLCKALPKRRSSTIGVCRHQSTQE